MTYQRNSIVLLQGLVEAEKLKPGDLVGVNKISYLILDRLPSNAVKMNSSVWMQNKKDSWVIKNMSSPCLPEREASYFCSRSHTAEGVGL